MLSRLYTSRYRWPFGSITFSTSPTTLNIGDATNTGEVVFTNDLAVDANTIQIASGASLDNEGSEELSGGTISGAGTLINDGTISGMGSITSAFSNQNDGVITVGSGTMRIADAFTNAGLVQVTSFSSVLNGGKITNNGLIEGLGNVKNNIDNATGTITAFGLLDLTGNVQNDPSGTIEADAGDEVLVGKGLADNEGLISLSSGEFNNNGEALDNTGTISGYGTFTTGIGGLTTSGTVDFSGGTTAVDGITDVTGGTVDVYNTTNFNGAVTINGGAVTTHSANAVFAAGLTVIGGRYINDPSETDTTDLNIGPGGGVGGGPGSVYKVSGNINNQSTQNTLGTSMVEFVASGDKGDNAHSLTWSVSTGQLDIGNFTIDNNQTVQTENTESGSTGVLNVGELQLDSVIAASSSGDLSFATLTADTDAVFTSGNLTIYYNPTLAVNAYLQGQTISYGDGGEIEAAPEPSTWALLGIGLLAMAGRRQWLRRSPVRA